LISAYRLHSRKYAADDGTGAALFGGRWNPIGTPAIYVASSRSLAVLEILVHEAEVPKDFMITLVQIPEEMVTKLPPEGWQTPEYRLLEAIFGEPGPRSLESVWRERPAVEVPSAVIPEEINYVINPQHRDFGLIEFLQSVPFRFDPRLK
jgi:RES domain-containing protein